MFTNLKRSLNTILDRHLHVCQNEVERATTSLVRVDCFLTVLDSLESDLLCREQFGENVSAKSLQCKHDFG